MTGFASAQLDIAPDTNPSSPGIRVGLDVRSLNSRFLDLNLRLPDELRSHEGILREIVSAHIRRGKVEIRLSIESKLNDGLSDPGPHWLQRLSALQDKIQAWLPKAADLSVADVLKLSVSSAQTPGRLVEPEELTQLAKQAILQLNQARAREGKKLAQSLLERLGQLRLLAQQAQPLVPQLVEQQRLRFLERWRDAMSLADGVSLSETVNDRALSEATAFAIRIDVAEELTRLDSHLSEIERLLAGTAKNNEGIGKRLDFLIQELHREANTLGSKSAVIEMTQISVEMKVLIEQMREQVQNIE